MALITVTHARNLFLQVLDQFDKEREALALVQNIRRESATLLSSAVKQLKGVYFLTDEGIVYVSRVRGNQINLRKAHGRILGRLRANPGLVVDVRSDTEGRCVEPIPARTDTDMNPWFTAIAHAPAGDPGPAPVEDEADDADLDDEEE
jgi:hypothetical protein